MADMAIQLVGSKITADRTYFTLSPFQDALKKLLIVILAFVVTACNAIPSPNSPADAGPAIPEITQTPSLDPFLYPSNTPTVFSEATQTPIPITETARPWTSTPIPSSTVRANLPLKPGGRVDITSIQMIEPQNGWTFDSDFHILRTRDGGMTWQAVTPPTGYYTRAGFFALDADTAWATFSLWLYSNPKTAHVWRTDDGGETWRPSQQFRLDIDVDGNDNPSDYYQPSMMQFIDPQTGWLLVDVYSGMHSTRPLLFHTANGGENWITINDHYHGLSGALGIGFSFLDNQTGWYGQNSIPIKMGMHRIDQIVSDGGWKLLKTNDGGRSFTDFTLLPLPTELQQPELAGKAADCGETRMLTIAAQVLGVEWDCVIDPLTRYGFFALSADGGESWNSWTASGNESFLDGKHGWRLLSPGELQQTNDGGLNWVTIKSVAWTNAQFDLISEQEAWAIASNGETTALVHTVDGGYTWAEIKPVIAP
jgi:photosystem II stability/assembly factor-like uncharacterized protein